MSRDGISTWHVVVSGFLQNEGNPTGMVALWDDLRRRHSAPDTCILLREWSANFGELAELIWRLRPRTYPPTIFIYGYSWGGFSATVLARHLSDRGISVRRLILSDPVYRHPYWAGNWRAFWPWSTIAIPANVRDVTWFRQRRNFPRGHELVADDPRQTKIETPGEFDVVHQYMDDLSEFQQAAQLAAASVAPA